MVNGNGYSNEITLHNCTVKYIDCKFSGSGMIERDDKGRFISVTGTYILEEKQVTKTE